MDKLLDSASKYEKNKWSRYAFKIGNQNGNPHETQSDNFEDIYGY